MTLIVEGLRVLLLVSAPLLLGALASGLLVALFQAATQINEVTLSFVPKLLALAAVIAVAGPWMVALMTDYTRRLLHDIPGLLG